jgi:starvation-inducible DNA-binding protein
MTDVTNALNLLVADYQVHYQKLRNYHWNVKGPLFFGLHLKFEELYNAAAMKVDALAERVLALGDRPLSTLKRQLENARLSEDEASPDAEAMVRNTMEDLGRLNASLRETAAMAGKAGDEGTVNLIDPMADEQEQTVWMLRAFLG